MQEEAARLNLWKLNICCAWNTKEFTSAPSLYAHLLFTKYEEVKLHTEAAKFTMKHAAMKLLLLNQDQSTYHHPKHNHLKINNNPAGPLLQTSVMENAQLINGDYHICFASSPRLLPVDEASAFHD
ncbi:hypothetical protein Dimus_032097 [Dionaea muscipula]